MSLKKSIGNMYDWCTHMHTHLGGQCPHQCSYCYTQRNRFGVPERYKGELRFIENELNVDYGSDKIIFIEHMNDMFAEGVKPEWITKILEHCKKFPNNEYIFQTKNPQRVYIYIPDMPSKRILGTTIETNRDFYLTLAPHPKLRYESMKRYRDYKSIRRFLTVEPIMDFDVQILAQWVIDIRPEFVNIGADSKHCNLPEPPKSKILELIKILQENNINIRKKINLGRLLK